MSNSLHVNQDFERIVSESDALFMSIGDGAFVTNSSGEIIRINQTALELLNLKSEEVIGQWYADIIVAEDENGERMVNIDRPMTQVFLTGKPLSAMVKYRRRGQSPINAEMTVSPIVLDGQPIGAIEVFRDVTQEVALDNAKDEFIALASHQLRTPATGVKQYLGMLLQGYVGELTPEQTMMLKHAYTANERQLSIITDLLRVARVDAGEIKLKRKPIRIGFLIEEIIAEHKSSLKERRQTVSYQQDSDFLLNVDPNYMRMAIENIVDNASKYSPEDTTITIKTKSNLKYVSISIEDEGMGIAAEDIDSIFDKFFRLTHESSAEISGTGLGLYWVKEIIDLHGGSIKVESKPQVGTRFTIRIPR